MFQGKLDQKNCHFEVDFVIGRDIRKIDIGNIVGVLSAWCENCDTTLSTIENQVRHSRGAGRHFSSGSGCLAKLKSVKNVECSISLRLPNIVNIAFLLQISSRWRR